MRTGHGASGSGRSPTVWGFLSGALLLISADAIHWFFTPHPDAGTTRTLLVAAQLVLGGLGSILAWRRGKRLESGDLVARKEAPPA